MATKILFYMQRFGDNPNDVRLVRRKNWPEVTDEGLAWAAGKSLRIAEISPQLAAHMFKGVKVEDK